MDVHLRNNYEADLSLINVKNLTGGCTNERLLSESSRSYMLANYLSVFVVVATVLSTFRTDQPRFKFSPNRPWAISTDKILHTNEMLTSYMYERLDSLSKRS